MFYYIICTIHVCVLYAYAREYECIMNGRVYVHVYVCLNVSMHVFRYLLMCLYVGQYMIHVIMYMHTMHE